MDASRDRTTQQRYSDESNLPILMRVANEPVPDLRERGVPDRLAAVIEAAMAKDPEVRPTVNAFGDALRAVHD